MNPKTGQPYRTTTKAYPAGLGGEVKRRWTYTLVLQDHWDADREMVDAITSAKDIVNQDVNLLLKHGKGVQSHFCEYYGGLSIIELT